MSEHGILDARTWKIVCDFFRVGKRKASDGGGIASVIGSVFGGFPALAAGAVGGAVPGILAGVDPIVAGAFGISDDSSDGKGTDVRSVLSWYAKVPHDSIYYWRLRVHVAVDTANALNERVVISVKDGQHSRIDKAVLMFLGSELDVKNGLAEYSLKKFQESLSNSTVYLVFSDGRRVEGKIDVPR